MGVSRPKVESLYDQGIRALEEFDFDKALEIGDRLIAHRYSGGHEVRARALDGLDKSNEAITLLEDGTKRFPSVPVLWSYLGEYYSNSGRYDDAIAAFQSFVNHGGDQNYGYLNLSVTYGRMGDFARALQFIEDVPVGSLDNKVDIEQRAHVLNNLGRFSEALATVEADLEHERWARLLKEKARALAGLGRHKEAKEHALAVIAMDNSNLGAAEILRRYNPTASAKTKCYRIQVEGTMTDPYYRASRPRDVQFLATFWAYVDEPEEALSYYKEFEPKARDVKVSSFEVLDKTIEGNKGVVSVHGGHTFIVIEPNWFKRLIFRFTVDTNK